MPTGTGNEAPVWDSLQAKADGFFSPIYDTSSAFYWNGDDCVVLLKGTLPANPAIVVGTISGIEIIDIFGKIGERPTNTNGSTSQPTGGWSTIAPYNGGPNGGAQVSVDHSLIRKPNVKKGVVNPAISVFNPLAEYDSIPPVIVRLDSNGDTIFGTTGNPILDGNWNSLGTHTCDCNPLSVSTKNQDVLTLYPNPSTGSFTVKGLNAIDNISVFNTLGQRVSYISTNGKTTTSFDLEMKGVYIVRFNHTNGDTSTKKVIVK